MTIPAAEGARAAHTGNGIVTTFAYTWKILAAADLRVEVNDALVSNYSVTGVGSDTGGNVVFSAAPTGTVVITLSENAIHQDADLSSVGALDLASIEDALDRVTNASRYLAERVRRAMVMPASTGLTNVAWPAPTGKGGYYLRVNAAGSGFEALALAPATDLAAFLQSGTGAVSRTATAKMGELVSVKDFGALGDDATDDTAAIQNAITALAVINANGGTLYFPPGIYRVTQLSVPSKTRLLGAGPASSILRRTAASGSNFSGIVTNSDKAGGNADIVLEQLGFSRTVEVDGSFDEHVYFENVTRPVILGCRFLGVITTAAPHEQKGVHLRGCTQGRILGNHFEEIGDNALALNYLSATVVGHHLVAGNTFVRTNTDAHSEIIVTQSDVTIVGNVLKGASTTGVGSWIETGQGNGASIHNVTLVGNTVAGLGSKIHDADGVVVLGNVLDNADIVCDLVTGRPKGVLVQGNVFTGGGFIQVKSCDHVQVIGNHVTDARATRSGILVENCGYATIIGNHCRRADRNGIKVDATITGPLLLAENHCYDNGQGASADDWFGIFLANVSTDAVVRGNYTHDTQGGSATQRHGLAVNGGTRLTLADNHSRDNLTGAYREVTTPTYARRRGNVFNGAPEDEARVLTATATFDPPNILDGAQTTTTVTVTGAAVGDPCWVGFSNDLLGVTVTAYVSAANTVTVVFQNESAGAKDLASGTLRVAVVKF